MPQRELVAIAVEDDPGDLELLRWYLREIREWRVELTCYADPRAALRAFEAPHSPREPGESGESGAREPDVVFLDGELETPTSAELVLALRRRGYEGPIIVLQDGPHFEESESGLDPDGDRLARSMLSCNSLRRSVGNALAKSNLRRAARTYARHLALAVRARERAEERADALARALETELVPALGELGARLEASSERASAADAPGRAELADGAETCARLGRALDAALGLARSSPAEDARAAGAAGRWSEVSVNALGERALARLRNTRPSLRATFAPAPEAWIVLVREEHAAAELARLLERAAAAEPAGTGEVVALEVAAAGPGLVRFAARAGALAAAGGPARVGAGARSSEGRASALADDPGGEPGRGGALQLLLPLVDEPGA